MPIVFFHFLKIIITGLENGVWNISCSSSGSIRWEKTSSNSLHLSPSPSTISKRQLASSTIVRYTLHDRESYSKTDIKLFTQPSIKSPYELLGLNRLGAETRPLPVVAGRVYKKAKCNDVKVRNLRVFKLHFEVLCSFTQTILTILIYFSRIDIFKAVHEGHINRSKIGNALISGIVTVFVTHICIFFFFPVFDFFWTPK